MKSIAGRTQILKFFSLNEFEQRINFLVPLFPFSKVGLRPHIYLIIQTECLGKKKTMVSMVSEPIREVICWSFIRHQEKIYKVLVVGQLKVCTHCQNVEDRLTQQIRSRNRAGKPTKIQSQVVLSSKSMLKKEPILKL